MEKYGKMDESEFENFINGRPAFIQTRMRRRRNEFYDGTYDKRIQESKK